MATSKYKILNAGDLNKRITLQKNVRSQNNFGEDIVVWTDITTVWAAVKQTLSKSENDEIYLNEQRRIKQMFEFVIRYITTLDFNEVFRIKFNNRFYDIKSINNLEFKNEQLLIFAERIE